MILKRIDGLLSKSKFTEEDAILLGRKVNKVISKKLKEL